MTSHRKAALLALALALLAAASTAAVAATAASPGTLVKVVGSGPIAWEHVGVRAAPRLDARVITTLSQFRADYRPRAVLAVRAVRDAHGKPLWYRVPIAGRPNGRSGWVPAASVSLQPVDRWLVIYRGSRRFRFVLGGRVVRSGPVAVGAPGMETPLGLFYVQAAFRPVQHPVLGAWAFETSGYSKLSDWPGGGVVGVHGTNTPQLIGQAVSHGCVRLLNSDIDYLRRFIRVGTPIRVVAG